MTARLGLPSLGIAPIILALAALLGLLAGVQPSLAIAGAFGLAFVALVLGNLTVGVCIFTFVSFLDVLPSSPALSLTKIIGVLLAISWVATVATRHDKRGLFFDAHPYASFLLLVFLCWSGMSVIWAESASVAVNGTTRFALNMALFPIMFTAVRERRAARWVAIAFVLGALLSGAYGLLVSSGDASRLSGAVGEANELASVLLAGGVLAFALGVAAKRASVLRAIAFGSGFLMLLGVLLTLSRGGLLALGVVAAATVFAAGRRRGAALTAVLLVSVIAVTYFAAFAAPQARERVTNLGQGTGRVDLWTIGWRMSQDKPLTGVGLDNFRVSSVHYLLQPGAIRRSDFVIVAPKQTHNIYLQMLSELGIPGLLMFLGIIGFSLSCAAKAALRFRQIGDGEMQLIAWGVFVAAMGILAADFFQSTQFSKQLWLLLSLGPALLAIALREPAHDA